MAWYNSIGDECDVVVSSRIRFARNIADYPFDTRLDKTSCDEIIEKVKSAFDGMLEERKMTPLEAGEMVEKHFISPMFAKKKLPHALLLNEKDDVSVMVCEEDHIRLQCIKAGLDLETAYETACRYDDMAFEKLSIAFSDEWGYLTHCPTNLGTGMRASVMVFLPALTITRSIELLSRQLSDLGLTIRGTYGEGTEADGCLYQISNRVTMGVTEAETVNKLKSIVLKVCEKERNARDVLKSDSFSELADRVGRAYGIMKYARIMSSKEFMKLYSDVRLGISLGLVDGIGYETLGETMIEVLPASLTLSAGGKQLSGHERDVLRADLIRSKMTGH